MLKRIMQVAVVIGMSTGGASAAMAAQTACTDAATSRAAKPQAQATSPTKASWPDLQLAIDRDIAESEAAFAHVWNDLSFASAWDPFWNAITPTPDTVSTSGDVAESVAPFSEIWFADPAPRAVQISTRKDHGNVVMAVQVPGVDPKAIDVRVEGDHLRVRYDVKNVDVQKDHNGKVLSRSESEQQMVESVPLPAHVNGTRASIDTNGSEVVVRLPQKI